MVSGQDDNTAAQQTAERIERSCTAGVELDLKRLTHEDPSTIVRVGRLVPRFAGWLVEHYLFTSGVLTLAVGGFYGLAYTRFYRALDVTPEQAGLSTANIVTQSVLGGLALFALVSLGCFLILVPLAHLKEQDESRAPKRGAWGQFAGHMVIAAFAIGGLLWLSDKAKLGLLFGAFCGALTAFLALIAGLRVGWRRYHPTLSPRPLEVSWEGYVAYIVALAIPAGIFFTGLMTLTEAARYGAQAAEGNAVRSPDILGIPFLGVRAEPALVTWKEGRPANVDTPRCVFYIGTANGETLLYDHRTGTTSEVPSDDIVIDLRRTRTSCEAPVNIRLPTVRALGGGRYRCYHGGWQSHSHPAYSYRWSTDGFTIPARYGGESRVLRTSEYGAGWIAHCHVTAMTPLGSDAAVSQGVLVTAKRPARHAGSGGHFGAPHRQSGAG